MDIDILLSQFKTMLQGKAYDFANKYYKRNVGI